MKTKWILMMILAISLNLVAQEKLVKLQNEFQDYSGARLAFKTSQLPKGQYHDYMPSLNYARKLDACRILLKEVKKYPKNYLGTMGLKAVGFFQACVSKKGDGFRPYNKEYKGYLYFGIWNGKNALAGAYYNDTQLPLTFHHEIFHHVDATYKGKCSYYPYFKNDDTRYTMAISGKMRYSAPAVETFVLKSLIKKGEGYVLSGAVSDYSKKNLGEDQAETARYFMTNIADSLVQVVQKPNLAGSQRILHVMNQYQSTLPYGPDVDWFVSVALGYNPRKKAIKNKVDFVKDLKKFSGRSLVDIGQMDQVRRLLRSVSMTHNYPAGQRQEIIELAAQLTNNLMYSRIQPNIHRSHFRIYGKEDKSGINWTLRTDLAQYGIDAMVLRQIQTVAKTGNKVTNRAILKNLYLLSRYYGYIAGKWQVTSGTKTAFDDSRKNMIRSLDNNSKQSLANFSLEQLAKILQSDGSIAGHTPKVKRNNPYLHKVDQEISNSARRKAIRAVQPACVRFPSASGVIIHSSGIVLTAAHVAKTKGRKIQISLPDGTSLPVICTYIDHNLDIAVCRVTSGAKNLPSAPLAAAAPVQGTWVVCIGQPGTTTPRGRPTNYQPFHVSIGEIRGFRPNIMSSQKLGRTKHDAWTYWGHSGSPLFNKKGEIVAMHNSWDSTTAMRHAVPYQVIKYFLDKNKIPYRIAK